MKVLYSQDIKEFLDEKYHLYNQKKFIEDDPISIPHLFSDTRDIEIAGLFAATLAWGNRKTIIKNAKRLIELMDQEPYQFITQHQKKDLKKFENFVHRTFNGEDVIFFIKGLRQIYSSYSSLEKVFLLSEGNDLATKIVSFREAMLEAPHNYRSEKHLSNPLKKSTAKRLCMYLRWMVRADKKGVDFGIWKEIPTSALHLPLDVHTGNISRKLGLLKRQQNDWQAVEEITNVLRQFDAADPVKYDFALFGLGVEKAL